MGYLKPQTTENAKNGGGEMCGKIDLLLFRKIQPICFMSIFCVDIH